MVRREDRTAPERVEQVRRSIGMLTPVRPPPAV